MTYVISSAKNLIKLAVPQHVTSVEFCTGDELVLEIRAEDLKERIDQRFPKITIPNAAGIYF
jgi:hypothetical protein